MAAKLALVEVAPSAEERAVRLNPILADLLDQLVVRIAARNGETVEQARRGVELAVVSRGIGALQEELRAGSEVGS